MEQHQAPSGSDSDEDLANHAIPQQTLASQPGNQCETLSEQCSGPPASPQTLKAPAPPSSKVPTRTLSSRRRKQSSEEEDADVDLYYKHRGEASKLSRRWHKKLHQAANAFAAAQFSGNAQPSTGYMASPTACTSMPRPSCQSTMVVVQGVCKKNWLTMRKMLTSSS